MWGFLGEQIKHLWHSIRKQTGCVTNNARSSGQQAEDNALEYLRRAGLNLLARNYRTPGRGGGEIDLIMREPDGTLVFVEVRSRATFAFGGAASSVGHSKQQRLRYAARHFLLCYPGNPACRFDVVAVDTGRVQWLRAAFDET